MSDETFNSGIIGERVKWFVYVNRSAVGQENPDGSIVVHICRSSCKTALPDVVALPAPRKLRRRRDGRKRREPS